MQQKEILPWRQEEGIGELFVAREMVEEAMAEKMPGLVDLQWVQVLSEGPALLKGFIREKQFLQSQHFTCLLDSAVTNQSVPIVLAVTTMDRQRVEGNTNLVLGYRGVAQVMASGDWLVGGELEVFKRINWSDGLDRYRLTLKELALGQAMSGNSSLDKVIFVISCKNCFTNCTNLQVTKGSVRKK